MMESNVRTCHNCDGISSRVTVFADGYVLCVRCKRAMQDRFEQATGWKPQPATPDDEALRRAAP